MTILASGPLDDPDLVDLVADTDSPLGVVRMADFKAACRADADANSGWVHPSRVSALLHERFGDINPRSFSAKWAPACGRDGFLVKTDVPAPIDPAYSRGNGNKATYYRKWRDWPDT